MDFYSCKLRLHGVTTNEVMKHAQTAPEILILRKLHGDDSVVNLEYTHTTEIDEAEERERLSLRYDSGLRKAEGRPTSVAEMFGENFQSLLSVLPELKNVKRNVIEAEKEEEETEEDETPPVEAKSAPKSAKRVPRTPRPGVAAAAKPVGAVI